MPYATMRVEREARVAALGCQNRQKYIEQLGIDEKARGVEYKKEKERLSALSVAEQDKIFWAKFGMTGPPPRST